MQIVTWNVNSLRARHERMQAWLESRKPDVVGLQETKVVDEKFPHDLFTDLGYSAEVFGQPTYNGVALVVRDGLKIEDIDRGLPGDQPEDQKRLIAGTVNGVRIVNVYVPNGSEVGSDKYEFKLRWLERFKDYLAPHAAADMPLVVMGDFNIAPDDRDIYEPDKFRDQVLCSPKERAAFQALLDLGLSDLHRQLSDEGGIYTWWDYRRLGFPKNKGWRIDLFLVNEAAQRLGTEVRVDRDERKGKGASDHAPVFGVFDGV